MQRRHDRGQSYADILNRQDGLAVVPMVRATLRRVSEANARFGTALARELHREGGSHRQIANWLGVSHQRVTAMLNHHRTQTPSD